MMKILISNDDGVYADGLSALVQELQQIAEVVVVAPDRNRSGASNSLTLMAPLHIKQLPNGFYSVEGTPTDCVHVAITGLLEQVPDMVVTGVNAGANLGDDVWYSGTVAAAMEGRFLGLPALAISLVGDKNYATAARAAKRLVEQVIADPLPASTILNVNVPDLAWEECGGFDITRLGTRHQASPTIIEQDPRGNTIYWVGMPGPEQDAGPGTDFCAIREKNVSITPLNVDITHYQTFEQLAHWAQGLAKKRG